MSGLTTAITDRAWFDGVAQRVCVPVDGAERVALYLRSEVSDFIRFNRGAVRQATQVTHAVGTLSVVSGARRIESSLTLSGDAQADVAVLLDERARLIATLVDVPEDRFLLLPDAATHSTRDERGALPTPAALVDAVATAAHGLDFVGFYAGGPIVRAYADSLGSRHWHHVVSFHIDWCLYHGQDKAVKSSYAGSEWRNDEFARRVAVGAERVALLALPPKRLPPGAYRAWLTPTAMNEVLGILGWGGFGARARRNGTSSLGRLASGDLRLHPSVHLDEDARLGSAPAFSPTGFARPPVVSLVAAGVAIDTLNSPRSAGEYGLQANAASDEEGPQSLRLRPGSLAESDVLSTLGTGLYVSNLWYLAYSDRPAGRITGMTRFACFWVEDGKLVAPLDVMRFDDSALRMLGDGLVALGERADVIPDGSTWDGRQLGSTTTPGALIAGWQLTL